ncbi:MAG: tetratricopeptide repeat protein [Nitrospinaceae bacterium]
MNPRNPGSENRRFFIPLTALFLLIVLAYANTFYSPFNYDDEAVIHRDIKEAGERFFQVYPPQYRHVFYLSLALNYRWGRADPFGYHLVNLLLHLLTSGLVLFITFFTINRGTPWGKEAAVSISLLTAFLFALNPVQSETVTYISGRASGLAGFFYLLSLLLFILGSLKEKPFRFSTPILYLISLASFFLAVLSKEISVTFPAVIVLYDAFIMRGEKWGPFKERLFYYYLPVPIFAVIFLVQTPSLGTLIRQWLPKIDPAYALSQLAVIGYAVKLYFFPVNLTFDYDFPGGFFVRFLGWIGAMLIVSALLLAALGKFWRAPALFIFSILWFLITIAPTNSFLPRPDLLSERNLYLPSFGLSVLLAAPMHLLFFASGKHPFRPVLGVCCLAVLLSSNAALLVQRNSVYRSNVLLWEDTLRKSPGKLRALHNLSHFYLKEKNYPKALVTLKKLSESNASPFYLSFAHTNLGSLYSQLGKEDLAEREFKEAIRADSTIPTGHYNLASLYASRGQFSQAIAEYEKADERYRNYRWGYPRPPELSLNKARVYLKLGRYEEAEKAIKTYLEQTRDPGEGRLILGQIQAAAGRKEQALESFRNTEGKPALRARAHNNAGIVLIGQGKVQEAIREFEQALEFNPNLPDAHFNLGSLLLETQGGGTKARAHLEKARALNRDPARDDLIRARLRQLDP